MKTAYLLLGLVLLGHVAAPVRAQDDDPYGDDEGYGGEDPYGGGYGGGDPYGGGGYGGGGYGGGGPSLDDPMDGVLSLDASTYDKVRVRSPVACGAAAVGCMLQGDAQWFVRTAVASSSASSACAPRSYLVRWTRVTGGVVGLGWVETASCRGLGVHVRSLPRFRALPPRPGCPGSATDRIPSNAASVRSP